MARDLLKTLAPHMIVGLSGPSLSAEERRLLAELPFAGVILFERNVTGSRGLMELNRELRAVFGDSHGIVPLIAADHEGGVISVLGRSIGVPPSQAAAARAESAHPGACGRLFTENARRMRAVGANMLLGPVADVNSDRLNPVIGTRSFGEEASVVSPLVAAAVAAARREGLLTCLKHFPGHGPSSVDSHLALPTLDADLDELRERHVPPFAAGIASGADAVMIGHIAPRGRELPASLDPEIVGGLLRRELGFGGVVMTDALEMEGVNVAPPAVVSARSLRAGNDILLFSKPVGEVAAEGVLADGPSGDALGETALSGALEPSRERIARLLSAAASRDGEFELPADAAVYREIAAGAVEVAWAGGGTAPAGGGLFGVGALSRGAARAPRIVFYAGDGEFERFALRSFMGRVMKALASAPGGWGAFRASAGASRPTAADAAEDLLGPVDTLPASARGIEGRLFPREDVSAGSPDIVFLLNRRPVSADAVRDLSSGAKVVVVAGWPHAAELVPPGRAVITTSGVYDAAADEASRLILEA
jgi:beta-glucosidase-like glycosyl hydrolase